jgi:hypothetical protein
MIATTRIITTNNSTPTWDNWDDWTGSFSTTDSDITLGDECVIVNTAFHDNLHGLIKELEKLIYYHPPFSMPDIPDPKIIPQKDPQCCGMFLPFILNRRILHSKSGFKGLKGKKLRGK